MGQCAPKKLPVQRNKEKYEKNPERGNQTETPKSRN